VILIIFLTLLSTVVIVTKSSHTVTAISTDKSDYNPDETVTISGFFFVSNAKVDVEVIGPDGILSSWIVNSDGEGDFVTTYHLDGTTGMYIAKVSDGINGRESTFTLTAQETVPQGTPAATITTDKSDYNFEEVATIKGCGFQPNAKVNVEVTRPDGSFSNLLIESDAAGLFFSTYGLDATTGIYTVKASDGFSGTETSFMVKASNAAEQVLSTQPEGSVDFKQP
jgi:hypothetical protein